VEIYEKHCNNIIESLVGGFNPSEKYWSIGRIIPYIMENKKCLKPPTRLYRNLPFFASSSNIDRKTLPWYRMACLSAKAS
jgi:hypothetical protein